MLLKMNFEIRDRQLLARNKELDPELFTIRDQGEEENLFKEQITKNKRSIRGKSNKKRED